MNKERQEILLKEYEICQKHNDSIGSYLWVSTTIFISANAALLGWLVKDVLLKENIDLFSSLVITTISVALILILCRWKRWIGRMQFLTRINYERMREIETELGMRKNWLAFGFDQLSEVGKLKDDEKKQLEYDTEWFKKMFMKVEVPKYYAKPAGFDALLKFMATTLIVLWGILILWLLCPLLLKVIEMLVIWVK